MAELPLVLPEFLNESEEEIHERMLKQAPSNFDVSEGSLFWDITKPTAMEKAKILEFTLPLLIMHMLPQFAEGIFLDYHGEREGISRRAATYSTGTIEVTGVSGTFIPAGTTLTTDEVDGVSIEYRTIADATIDESGVVKIQIEALESGTRGNVPSNSIKNLLEPVSGVHSITNVESTIGGYDEENDEEFRERILQTSRTRSFTGTKEDYIRWAKEIPGVGEVLVVPEWDGPGTVKVLIASSSGSVAAPELIKQVQTHIAPDGRDGGGLAPIGALVTVTGINGKSINLSFAITLAEGYTTENVRKSIESSLSGYFGELEQGGLVRYMKIGAIIMTTPGVVDYDNLLVNGGSANIQLAPDEVAVIGEVLIA
ncbi:MAG TPA: hypothetical protein DEO65_04365 [Bacillus bacterium]|uniref:baseplate J/gp47 family protein n=1 Tax=Siminovitchia fordii TaxID=254759 RepID=UPI00036DC630|nr:baseplate J/gp47 family protein [Siminovitchia fordii]HBZ09109.1 hypothetical protein [Bacillus sp. (in: firmicutes)]